MTAFELDGSTPKGAKAENSGDDRVITADKQQANDAELRVAAAGATAKLAKVRVQLIGDVVYLSCVLMGGH